MIFKLYLFLAALGLAWCAQAFSSCGKRGLLFFAVQGPLSGGFSCGEAQQALGLVAVAHGLSCPAAGGILIPGPGIEPRSPALVGRFLITGPSGMSLLHIIYMN